MTRYLLLADPSANRVYRQSMPALCAAELAITVPQASDITPCQFGKIPALRFAAPEPGPELLEALARQSSAMACMIEDAQTLVPLDLPAVEVVGDDLLTIPKYQGKTNEAFTRLLAHLTCSVVDSPAPLRVLDPMAGRGTTLLAAWIAGHHGYGVEADAKAVEALSAYIKTYLRQGRYKHTAEMTPVRREGAMLGKRLDVVATLGDKHDPATPRLEMTVFTGDTRDSAALYGKRTFDAIITDAPYGVVHGAQDSRETRGRRTQPARTRLPGTLLAEAIPVWARQLREGGALGVAFNTLTLPRDQVVQMVEDAGLVAFADGPWLDLAHRVDSSILRDVVVARKLAAR